VVEYFRVFRHVGFFFAWKRNSMNRIQCLIKGLALSLILVAVAGLGLAQEKLRKPQDGPRTSMIDDLWRQMGQVQKQIVGLEVGDANPRAIPRREPLPADIAQASSDNAPQRASAGKSRDVQKPESERKTVPGQEPLPKLRDSTAEFQIDQLWRQITELQKTILKLEIADTNPRLIAIAPPPANSNAGTERSDTASTRNSERRDGNGDRAEFPQKSVLGQQKPVPPRGGSNESQIGQLWQQIGQLYKQIVALEVGDTGPRGY
jgi:hypothetical protein